MRDIEFPEGESGPACGPSEISEMLFDIQLFLFWRDDYGVCVGLFLDGWRGEVGGVSLDDVIRCAC